MYQLVQDLDLTKLIGYYDISYKPRKETSVADALRVGTKTQSQYMILSLPSY